MSLKEQLKADLKEAMKNKDTFKRDTIRFLNSAIKQVEVDTRVELKDEDIIKIIQKSIKQRDDAASQYKEAGREDLYETEIAQANILKEYLPKQLSDDELKAELSKMIEELNATKKDFGKVMGMASKKLAGVASGQRISQMAKQLLG
jgi:uncharacterized protein YqeY